jgi:hypothetical protein
MSTPIQDDAALPPEMAELMAYVDGELDAAGAAAFEAKLRSNPELAAQTRALMSVSDFVRGEGDRVFGELRVDSVAQDVMQQLAVSRASAVPPTAMPETSPQTRARRGTVLWVTFGTVCAAAAALSIYVNRHSNAPDAPVAGSSAPASVAQLDGGATGNGGDKVAKVVVEPHPGDESTSVELRELEVGEGATVIYTREHEDGPSTATVWIEDAHGNGAMMSGERQRRFIKRGLVALSAVLLSASGAALAAPKAPRLEITSLHGTTGASSSIPSGYVIPTMPPWNTYNQWTIEKTETVTLDIGSAKGFLIPNGYGGAVTLNAISSASADLEIQMLDEKKAKVFRASPVAVPGKRFCPAIFNPYKGGVLGVCFKLIP